ncbi:MAG: hypothetical protein ACXVFM_01865 [Solirubrobacteraceae bacterium]
MRKWLGGLGACRVLILHLSMLLVLLAAMAAPGRAHAAVSIGKPVARTLPAGFAGFSVETDLLARWFAAPDCRTPAASVVAFLGVPEVRVGGNSQDRLWPALPLPPGQRKVAGAPFLQGLHCLAQTGAPVVVGLNLLGRSAGAAGDLLAAVQTVVPPGQLTVALGNEPNLYNRVFPTWGGYREYIRLYTATLAALQQRFGASLPAVAGPDVSTWRWGREVVRFIADGHPNVIDVHLYGMNGCCRLRSSPRFPTIARLLRPSASSDLVRGLAPVAKAARRAGVPVQISEANSVACGGRAGVSDTPASALWALSVLGSAASSGFGRVQFHSAGMPYDPFVASADGRVSFRPLLTAMILANRLWPSGTRPLLVRGSQPAQVHAWAGRRPDGHVGVLVVNADQQHAHQFVLDSTATRARYGRLLAAGERAVTLDGRRLIWQRKRPTWRGHRSTGALACPHGRAALRLPPASAAWLLLGD